MNEQSSIVKPENNQVAKKPDVKAWLNSQAFQDAIRQSLPKHLTSERFVRVCITAMMRVPKLAQCTQASLFKCLLDLSSLGLEPDGRRAHLIPYENRKTGTVEAQLIIDYKGLIELAKRSGEVKMWRAETVCENDEFAWNTGVVTHKINWLKPRGKMLAVYSYVRNENGDDDFEVMTLEQVESIRKRSKAANSGPWVTDYEEMGKKTVLRRHSKRLTLSPEFNAALEKDFDRVDDIKSEGFSSFDDQPIIEMKRPQRLTKSEPIDNPQIQNEPEQIKTQAKSNGDYGEDIISDPQRKRLFAIYRNAGIEDDHMTDFLIQRYGIESTDEIKKSDYEAICEWAKSGGQMREPGMED